jgi:Tfp pilus assembly protein PilV
MTASGRRTGFSLIEAIGAVVLLSVAIPPMLWAIREAHIQRVDPMMISRAHWAVSDKLEQIVADRNSASRGYGYIVSSNYPPESAVPGAPGMNRSVTVTETGANLSSPGSGYKRVTVRVGWTDARSVPRTLAVSTVVSEY